MNERADAWVGEWTDGQVDGEEVGAVESCGATPKVGFTLQNLLTSFPFPPFFRALQKSYTPIFKKPVSPYWTPMALLSSPRLASSGSWRLLTQRTCLFTAERQLQKGGIPVFTAGFLEPTTTVCGAEELLNKMLSEGENKGRKGGETD